MKKLLLGALLLLLSTTKIFSQNVTNFGLYIINPTNCPYSITGYWVDSIGIEGPLFFTVGDTSSTFQDIWYGQAVSISATSTMSICVVPAPPCNCPPACIQPIPVTQGSYTILLCDSIVGIEEQPILSLLDNKYYDLLGREIKDISTYPMFSFYINRGKKHMKL